MATRTFVQHAVVRFFLIVSVFVYLSGASGDDPVYPNGFHDGSNYEDEGFPSAAFNFPLRSRINPKTNVQYVNSLENGYPSDAEPGRLRGEPTSSDSADNDISMMHGQLRRYVIPPKDPPPPEKL